MLTSQIRCSRHLRQFEDSVEKSGSGLAGTRSLSGSSVTETAAQSFLIRRPLRGPSKSLHVGPLARSGRHGCCRGASYRIGTSAAPYMNTSEPDFRCPAEKALQIPGDLLPAHVHVVKIHVHHCMGPWCRRAVWRASHDPEGFDRNERHITV